MASTPINTSMTPAPVLDAQANQILKDIYSFLNKQNDQNRSDSDNLQSGIDNLTDRIERDNKLSRSEVNSNNKAVVKALTGIANSQKKESTRSSRSEARDRATNQIFRNDLNKKLNAFSLFKSGLFKVLDGLKDFIGSHLAKSFKAQSDLAAIMRKANMTREQKNMIQLKASGAVENVSKMFDELQVSRDEITSYIGDLVARGKDIESMSEEQIASYVALRKRGQEDIRSFDTALNSTAAQLRSSILTMGDNKVNQTIKNFENVSEITISMFGGHGKALERYSKNAQLLTDNLGNAVNPEKLGKFNEVMMKLQAGQVESFSDEENRLLQLMGGGSTKDSAAMIKILQKNLQNQSQYLARTNTIDAEFAKVSSFVQNNSALGAKTMTEEEIKTANEQNTTNGRVNQAFDNFTAKMDTLTGGLFGKAANIIDEMFGTDTDMPTLVSKGFKAVIGLLTFIKMSDIFSGGIGKLASGLKGLGLKGVAGALGKGAVQVITKIPQIAAIAAAAGSVYAAWHTISDTKDRADRFRNADSGLKDAKANVSLYKEMLEAAKVSGRADDIKLYESKLADAESNLLMAESEREDALHKVDKASEIAYNFQKQLEGENSGYLEQMTEIVKARDSANAAGRKDLAEQLDKHIADLTSKINENQQRVMNATIGSNTTGMKFLAGFADAFGYDISPETLENWGAFTKRLEKFFTETIPNFFTETIPNFFTETVPNKLSELWESIKGWGSDKIKGIKDSIDSKFFEPLRGFFKFEWLPSPIKKVLFGAGEVIDNVKEKVSNTAQGAWDSVKETVVDLKDGFLGVAKRLGFYEDGGIVNKATPALVGEAGKEVILPLTRPDKMIGLISKLTTNEKILLIKSIFGGGGDIFSTIKNILFKSQPNKNTGPSQQEKSEYDTALAKLEAWQGGKLKPADFIAMFGPIAREDMRATGIPAAITIAQAALESGWGKSARADFRNLFGIKGVGDAGSKIIPTHEFNAAGERYNKKDTFAQYSSYLASINAHSQYLLNAKRKKGLNGLRYGEALLYTNDSDMFARKLKECGYATSPTYAEKLIGLMRQYDLYKYNVSSSGVKSGGILNTIKNSIGFKAVENVALQAGASTIATNMINGAKAQMGKKYSEMVCNQLVEAAMKWAGLTPPTTGSVYRHFNHSKMHLVLNDPNNGINPNDPKLIPGMILFSHPFTEAEALHYNNGKNGPRKAGDPGHMGIYAGNGLWWNSTSSKNTTDYSSGAGVNVTDSNKGFGVALTKPFTKGTYKLFAAGYYEGMYDAADVKNLADAPPKEYTSKDESQIKLTKEELDRLLAEGISTAIASGDTSKLIESAKLLLSASSPSGAPNVPSEIIKYLKEIVLRMRGKPTTVAKPIRAPMG